MGAKLGPFGHGEGFGITKYKLRSGKWSCESKKSVNYVICEWIVGNSNIRFEE